MTNISISEEIATACPDLHVLALSCDVCNSEPDERLWQEIADEEKAVRASRPQKSLQKRASLPKRWNTPPLFEASGKRSESLSSFF